MRRRLHLGETADFSVLEELRQEGQTDWLAMVQRFDKEAAIGEMDCFMSRWTTARPGGFADADLAALRRLVPVLGLAIKSASLARVAQSLVEAYLGRDAGRRVLQGKVSRGAAERINAVIWFSDMQGYTSLSERIESDQLIPLLNDYAEVAITAVHARGRRRAEADGRRRAGDLHGRRSGRGLRGGAACRSRAAAEASPTSTSAGRRPASRSRRSISACTSATSSTATSAARTGSTSPSSARPSTRRAASPRCAGRSTATCCSRRISGRRCRKPSSRRLVSVGRYALRGVGRAAGTVHARPGDCRRFMTGGSV